ncbi:hypothetical protein [Methanosarcina mazei]|nr:hypothetical protein [Methanosarcina mazei]
MKAGCMPPMKSPRMQTSAFPYLNAHNEWTDYYRFCGEKWGFVPACA